MDELGQNDRDRITRLEAGQSNIEKGIQEIKLMIQNLGAAYVPRGELEVKFQGFDARHDRSDARLRDVESAIQTIVSRSPAEPGWTKLLLALVSILGGTLLTLIVTLAIYYRAQP